MTSSVYNYVNDAKVWLPMTSACHDPVNVRTLDVSKNKLNYRFGDGALSGSFPTKLSGQRGYFNDTVNKYLEALANQTDAITQGTWAVFFRLDDWVTNQHLVSHYDALGNCRCIVQIVANIARFYCGDVANPVGLTVNLRGNNVLLAGYRTTDGYRRLYVNGLIATPVNAGVSLPGAPTTNPRIFNNYVLTTACYAKVFWYGHWEYALSELQLRDLEQRLRRQLNDV